MLSDKPSSAVIAVKDMEAAKKFYEGKLGFTVARTDPGGGGNLYKSGETFFLVYPSQFAGTNQATAASWAVGDDLQKTIDELKAKGVKFEQYDMPGVEREGDIHVYGELKSAWFKDPDGNILNLVNQM